MEFHVNISTFKAMKIESDSFEARLRHGVSFRRVHPDRFGRSHGRGATCVWTGCYCVFFSTWPPLPQPSPVSFFLAAWWNRVRGAYVDQSNPQFSLTYLMTRHHEPFFFFPSLRLSPDRCLAPPPPSDESSLVSGAQRMQRSPTRCEGHDLLIIWLKWGWVGGGLLLWTEWFQ